MTPPRYSSLLSLGPSGTTGSSQERWVQSCSGPQDSTSGTTHTSGPCGCDMTGVSTLTSIHRRAGRRLDRSPRLTILPLPLVLLRDISVVQREILPLLRGFSPLTATFQAHFQGSKPFHPAGTHVSGAFFSLPWLWYARGYWANMSNQSA